MATVWGWVSIPGYTEGKEKLTICSVNFERGKIVKIEGSCPPLQKKNWWVSLEFQTCSRNGKLKNCLLTLPCRLSHGHVSNTFIFTAASIAPIFLTNLYPVSSKLISPLWSVLLCFLKALNMASWKTIWLHSHVCSFPTGLYPISFMFLKHPFNL